MKKRITVASAVVAAAAAVTSALLARRARFFAQAPKRNETFATTAGYKHFSTILAHWGFTHFLAFALSFSLLVGGGDVFMRNPSFAD